MRTENNPNIWLFLTVFILTMVSPATGKIIYVDPSGSISNDGSSWADAYNFLQDALADANSAEKPVEIRVAQGIYKPDQGGGNTPGDREATFQLISGVTLKGGFAGLGESDPNAREISLYETILSGDLHGNDVDVNDPSELEDESTRDENSYHVVTGSGCDETAVLDGFFITGGNANGFYPHNRGGGMYDSGIGTTVLNCTFTGNSALHGGGMYNKKLSSPKLMNCTFSRNLAKWHGGGLSNETLCHPKLSNCTFTVNLALNGSGGGIFHSGGTLFTDGSLTLDNCSFIGNSASHFGGGIDSTSNCSTTLIDCTFTANTADLYGGGFSDGHLCSSILMNCAFDENFAEYGGAIYHNSKDPAVVRCTFRENWACEGGAIFNEGIGLTIGRCAFGRNWAKEGGAIFNLEGGSLTINCCTFRENSANLQGGALYNYDRGPNLTNCTFAGNSAPNGNAMAFDSYRRSSVKLINCILWDGGNEMWNNDISTTTINYSNIQGGWPGEGNIDADPLFVDPNNGDYHLLSERGRYWPEHDVWVLDKVTSPCIDSGDPNSDYSNEPTPNGGRINMGANGGTAYASMSEATIGIEGDFNQDGIIDIEDLIALVEMWLQLVGWLE